MKNNYQPILIAIILGLATTGFYSCNSEKTTKPEVVTPSPTNTFLVISDSHLHKGVNQDSVLRAGAADTGEDLWKITLAKFQEIVNGTSGYSKPDFVILLGDLPWHADPNSSDQLTLAHQSTGIVLRDLRKAAQSADVPLIYSPGNNDSWSGDYRAFTAPNGEIPFNQDTVGTKDWPVINSGSCGIKSKQACIADNSMERLGCYAVYPLGEKGGLKMIVLNTVMFAHDSQSSHGWHYYGPAGEQQNDTKAQMAWFKKQFTEGNPNDAIMIGMHIPPGVDGYSNKPMWNDSLFYNNKTVLDAFLEIVGKKKDRIVGVLTSHTHMDGLRQMMYSNNDTLEFSDLVVSIPGIAPGHGNNPGMKLFSYQPNTFEWLNFTTIYNDYWNTNNKKVSSTWGNDSFSSDTLFGGKPNTLLSKKVTQMDKDSLLEKVTYIYGAKGKSVDSKQVLRTLVVKPGQ